MKLTWLSDADDFELRRGILRGLEFGIVLISKYFYLIEFIDDEYRWKK